MSTETPHCDHVINIAHISRQKVMSRSRAKTVCLVAGVAVLAITVATQADWADPNRAFYLPVTVESGARAYVDKVGEVFVNVTGLLRQAGWADAVILESLRLVEVDPNGALSARPFQFDPFTPDSGTLVFLLAGVTPPETTREYRLYFDVVGDFEPLETAPLIELTDDVPDEGMLAYRIATPAATYFYQKEAGGFSSLLDVDGNDWINFHPWGGSDGIYRGIPNLVYPDNIFHPGHANCTSDILYAGPLKVTIHTISKNGAWECLWEIYPAHARLTILRAPEQPYWFLYEGTPGGLLDLTTDFSVRSDGTRGDMNQSWTADVPGPEWVYFEDSLLDRYLYFVHEDDDAEVDSFYQMQQNMTVFGFGRTGLNKYLVGAPRHFTIGLADGADIALAHETIETAYRSIGASIGPLASVGDPNQGIDPSVYDTTLAGHWQFDEGAGDIAHDASVFANHAVLRGAAWTNEGKSGGAIEFDGMDDYASIKGYEGVVGTQARTVAAWVRTQANDYVDLLSWGQNEPGARWAMLLTRGSRKEAYGALRVAVGAGYATGTRRVADGQWHHIAVVLEASDAPGVGDIRLYVDGEVDGISDMSDVSILTSAGRDVTFGVCMDAQPHYYNGAMDDVRIYSRAMSQA